MMDADVQVGQARWFGLERLNLLKIDMNGFDPCFLAEANVRIERLILQIIRETY